MKTTCYCVYCPKHPLFQDRNELDILVGWDVGNFIWEKKHRSQGKKVDCLKPKSNAFDELGVDPEDYEYPITAYNDAYAATGTVEFGYTIYAYCANEEYKD